MEQKPKTDKPETDKPETDKPDTEQPTTIIPVKDITPGCMKKYYREQAGWYQWAIEYSLQEAEKARQELEELRIKVINTPKLNILVECKELELVELAADARSLNDILETYQELSGDKPINPETEQMCCFD